MLYHIEGFLEYAQAFYAQDPPGLSTPNIMSEVTMRISVKVKPNAKQERVEKMGEGNFSVWIKEKPVEGRANDAAIRALAEYFHVPASQVVLIKGRTAREKVFEVM